MKKLEIQKYLETKSLQSLQDEWEIKASLRDHKFSLNYSQFNSRFGNKIVEESRGLILTPAEQKKITLDAPIGETKIMAYPFNKFYNWGEEWAHPIDWSTAEVQEKIDGTLIICYWDFVKNEWHVGTKKVPEADALAPSGHKTFRQLFEDAVKQIYDCTLENFTNKFNKKYTYCFELCTPFNQIIVKHQQYRLYVLGTRNNNTLLEARNPHKWLLEPQSYRLSSLEEITNWVNSFDPRKFEGVVVKDSAFNRIKIKNMKYVFTHKQQSNISASPRNLIRLILEEKLDDVNQYLPDETQEEVKKTKEALLALAKENNKIYKSFSSRAESRKEFAKLVLIESEINPVAIKSYLFGTKGEDLLTWISSTKITDRMADLILQKVKYVQTTHNTKT